MLSQLPVRILIYIAAAAVLVIGALYAIGHFFPSGGLQVYQSPPQVRVVTEPGPVREIVKWKTRTVEVPVVVREPTPKQAEAIQEDTGIDVPRFLKEGDKILGVYSTPKAPYGSDTYVGIKDTGEPRLVTSAKKAPFLELGGPWRVGVGVVVDDAFKPGWEAELEKDLATVRGSWHLVAEARAAGLNGETDVRLAAKIKRSF